MKVRPECALCLFRRGINQMQLSKADAATRFEGVKRLLEMLDKYFLPTSIPANLGTIRDRIIRQVTGVSDPYKQMKDLSNDIALGLEPYLQERIMAAEEGYNRFREACLISVSGNAIEFDVFGYEVDLSQLDRLVDQSEKELAYDDIEKFYEEAKKASHILFLTDNCGEIVFDKVLIKQLQTLGAIITVAVKGAPVLNDATLEDAKTVGLTETADRVITTGVDAVGVILGESGPEFKKTLATADFIVAKGMGNWENFPEQNPTVPVAYLLRTKCLPIAESLNVPRHKNVVRVLYPGDDFDQPQC